MADFEDQLMLQDFEKTVASNEYAKKVYEAYLKFEAVCKDLGIMSIQY